MNIQEQIEKLRIYTLSDGDELEIADTLESMQARNELLEKVYTLVIGRSHFCGGRDCTGFMSPDSATQYQCQMCRDMAEALAALKT